jgi:SAM-dependent methyltransferase
MDWSQLDWSTLDRLREGFLTGRASPGVYWKSRDDVAAYDRTYGERIGWKWDQVLRELRLRGWRPASRSVFDWGCGSGIASRRLVDFFDAKNFESLTLWDHAPVASEYATSEASARWPDLSVSAATPGLLASSEPIGLLLISHVLNELSDDQLTELQSLCSRAREIVWVEAGTHEVSRKLGGVRDALVVNAGFAIVAPCTHQLACPIFTNGNERHWCHFFAPPPSEIFSDPNWVRFGQRAGIDLRSLPYSFIALDRASDRPRTTVLSRVIGRPEHFKPYCRWLNCDDTGLAELELPKRADSTLFKQLERTKAPLVYRWDRDGSKVRTGQPLTDSV